MRPGRASDREAFLRFARQAVSDGEADVVPAGAWLERMFATFDWETRSRVVEREGRAAAGVLVLERPAVGGTIVRIEVGGEREQRPDLIEWALRYSRACGALAAQVWRGRGRGAGLAPLGLTVARPFLRMDRPALEALPASSLPAGYRLADESDPLPDEIWAEAYNASFADHWRFAPMQGQTVAARRSRPGNGPELLALTQSGAAAALVTCSVNALDDARAQPVGLVETVGTVPGHRRQGLAFALLAQALERLRAAGARSASLYVDGLNPTRAYDVYARAGFVVGFEFEVWEADFT